METAPSTSQNMNGAAEKTANRLLNNDDSPNNQQNSGINTMLKEALEARIVQLTGYLTDADRKNRKLEDELTSVKRELSKDNTEIHVQHKDAIRDLEKTYEKQINELEKQITKLETDARIDKIEYQRSDRDGLSRFLDFIEDKGDAIFSGIISQLQLGGNPQQSITAEQLQEAYQAQIAAQMNPETAENPQKTGNPNMHLHENEAEPAEKQKIEENQPNQDQLMAFQSDVSAKLIDTALMVLSDKNADLEKYANFVRDQLAILQQTGGSLDAKTWVEMAKALAERAIEEKITPERVSKIIAPVLEGVKQYAFMLKMVSPDKATKQLFSTFGVEAAEPVKKLVTKVLAALQKSL